MLDFIVITRDRDEVLIIDVLPSLVSLVVNKGRTKEKNIFKVFFVFRLEKLQEVIRFSRTSHSEYNYVERCIQVHFYFQNKNVAESN